MPRSWLWDPHRNRGPNGTVYTKSRGIIAKIHENLVKITQIDPKLRVHCTLSQIKHFSIAVSELNSGQFIRELFQFQLSSAVSTPLPVGFYCFWCIFTRLVFKEVSFGALGGSRGFSGVLVYNRGILAHCLARQGLGWSGFEKLKSKRDNLFELTRIQCKIQKSSKTSFKRARNT